MAPALLKSVQPEMLETMATEAPLRRRKFWGRGYEDQQATHVLAFRGGPA